ncbi:toll-like receptor 13 isoform X2 [Toxorhynchites rutilus septentrionalis]|uniref:toll-like receptor 13 isoform X2 n=1 Tax=Toxorhynchites rutilus septentrionalis TaxID=329112 RepID=UPI00247AD08F|nr:toll-like receptor 13 isoform X2 [Toxorhynchites rutilus septentrionalis]
MYMRKENERVIGERCCKRVRYLTFAVNRLTMLPVDSLERFSNVEFLSLSNNPFKEFEPALAIHSKLPYLPSLNTLDMRRCHLRVFPSDFFHGAPALQYLFLSHNYIGRISTPVFSRLSSLVHLDLSHMDSSKREREVKAENPFMKLIAGMDLDEKVFEPMKKLRFLDLSHSKLELKAFIALSSLGSQLEYVSYCYTNLPAIMDYLFLMKSIKMLDLSGNSGCARTLNANSMTLLRDSLEVLYFQNSNINRLDWLLGLRRLKVLNLRKNFLVNLENAPFYALSGLESIDISQNFIQSWSHRILHNNPKISVLNVRNNNLLLITMAMMEDFDALEYLAMGGNALQCTCHYIFFMTMIVRNNFSDLVQNVNSRNNMSALHNVQAERTYLFDYTEEDYQCMNFTSKKKINVAQLPLCPRGVDNEYIKINDTDEYEIVSEEFAEKSIVLYAISGSLLLVMLFLVFVIYWNWFYIKYFFKLLKNSAILSFFNDDHMCLDKSHLEEETPFHYDVFVSYSDNDRDWILDQMLPNLEREELLTVCLHERDFQVGYSILENIISCMDRSRCLLLIVSESFLLSRWCQFEMHLAQHRLLETRRDELILVLLEDIPKRKCPKTLSYLMKTKTYIKWPKERIQEQELFWKRLRKALLMSKR